MQPVDGDLDLGFLDRHPYIFFSSFLQIDFRCIKLQKTLFWMFPFCTGGRRLPCSQHWQLCVDMLPFKWWVIQLIHGILCLVIKTMYMFLTQVIPWVVTEFISTTSISFFHLSKDFHFPVTKSTVLAICHLCTVWGIIMYFEWRWTGKGSICCAAENVCVHDEVLQLWKKLNRWLGLSQYLKWKSSACGIFKHIPTTELQMPPTVPYVVCYT